MVIVTRKVWACGCSSTYYSTLRGYTWMCAKLDCNMRRGDIPVTATETIEFES